MCVIFSQQDTELICSATIIDIPASPTYCCDTTLGKQVDCIVVTFTTKVTHYRCTNWEVCSLSLQLVCTWS